MNIATIDFLMTVKSNGWSSDQLKYKDLAKDATMLVDMLDDLDADLEVVTYIFSATVNYDQVMRFFKLLEKGINQVSYHLGRRRPVQSGFESAHRREGPSLFFLDLCKVENALFEGQNGKANVNIVFENVLKIKNQQLRGVTIAANLVRLANALAWALVNDVKLSSKPVTMKTWNTITVWGENPWHKKVESPLGVPSADPDEDDIYTEE